MHISCLGLFFLVSAVTVSSIPLPDRDTSASPPQENNDVKVATGVGVGLLAGIPIGVGWSKVTKWTKDSLDELTDNVYRKSELIGRKDHNDANVIIITYTKCINVIELEKMSREELYGECLNMAVGYYYLTLLSYNSFPWFLADANRAIGRGLAGPKLGCRTKN